MLRRCKIYFWTIFVFWKVLKYQDFMVFLHKTCFFTDFMLSCKGHNSLKNNSILMIFFFKMFRKSWSNCYVLWVYNICWLLRSKLRKTIILAAILDFLGGHFEISNGSISIFFYYTKIHLCTKFGAFITKPTI